MSFKYYPSHKPEPDEYYLCRCIDENTGEIIYRVDIYRIPTVFEDKYKGVFKGWEGDINSSYKVNGFTPIVDDYSEHTIEFDETRKYSGIIDGEILELSLGQLKKSEEHEKPELYYYSLIGSYKGKAINEIIKVYCFYERYNQIYPTVVVYLPDITYLEIDDKIFNDYYNKYFRFYIIDKFNKENKSEKDDEVYVLSSN